MIRRHQSYRAGPQRLMTLTTMRSGRTLWVCGKSGLCEVGALGFPSAGNSTHDGKFENPRYDTNFSTAHSISLVGHGEPTKISTLDKSLRTLAMAAHGRAGRPRGFGRTEASGCLPAQRALPARPNHANSSLAQNSLLVGTQACTHDRTEGWLTH